MHIPTDLKEAIEEYLRGTASPYQQQLVNEWYRSFNDEEVEVHTEEVQSGALTEQRIRQRLSQTIEKSATKVVDMYPAPSKKRNKWWLAAAGVLLAASSLWFLLPAKKSGIPMEIVKTGNGETKQIVLPDSSRIWLSAMSQIAYPQTFDSKREVTIEGEAFFDIRHKDEQQFIVHAGKTHTTVLGTAFSVNSYQPDQQVVVTVMRGKVQVSDNKITSSVLTPGRQLSYTTATGAMKEQQIGSTENPDWMEGRLIFDAMPLQEITATLSRWYNVTFEFENDAIRQCNYTGKFTKDMKLKTVLELFSQINNINYKLNSDETTVKLTGVGCK